MFTVSYCDIWLMSRFGPLLKHSFLPFYSMNTHSLKCSLAVCVALRITRGSLDNRRCLLRLIKACYTVGYIWKKGGVYLISVPLIGVPLLGVPLRGVRPIGVHLIVCLS
jgi:hypothetical protein